MLGGWGEFFEPLYKVCILFWGKKQMGDHKELINKSFIRTQNETNSENLCYLIFQTTQDWKRQISKTVREKHPVKQGRQWSWQDNSSKTETPPNCNTVNHQHLQISCSWFDLLLSDPNDPQHESTYNFTESKILWISPIQKEPTWLVYKSGVCASKYVLFCSYCWYKWNGLGRKWWFLAIKIDFG